MPTRIVLDVADKRPVSSPKKLPFVLDEENALFPSRLKKQLPNMVPTMGRGRRYNNNNNNNNSNNNGKKRRAPHRDSSKRIVHFRSSIFRDDASNNEQEDKRGVSTTDIRASTRLIGYVYQLLASTVLLISVVKFYRNSESGKFTDIVTGVFQESNGTEVYYSVTGPVYFWKLVGCAVLASFGAGLTLTITLAHFDTVCLPRIWVAIFRDGSGWEQNLLRFMMLFWAIGLHVNTSSLSVGELQGNVYFTTWIAFAASVLNYGVWRTSSGLSSLAERVSEHHRETTYNWLWLLLCMAIFAGSATDVYFNRNELDIRFGPDGVHLSDRDWRVVLVIIWSFLALGLLSVVLNHYSTQSLDFRVNTKSRIIVGWRHCEGVIILLKIGVFYYMLIDQTGVDGVVNGLTNTYFSLWGCFFNSVFLFGTWLRENKDIEYYVDEEEANEPTRRGVTFTPEEQ